MLVEKAPSAEWLDPSVTTSKPAVVPRAGRPGRLTAYPVSKDVNNVRNDGAHLIEPLQLEDAAERPNRCPAPDQGPDRPAGLF